MKGRIVLRSLHALTLTFDELSAITAMYPMYCVPGTSEVIEIFVKFDHGEVTIVLMLNHGDSTAWYRYARTDGGMAKAMVIASAFDATEIFTASEQTEKEIVLYFIFRMNKYKNKRTAFDEKIRTNAISD